MTPSPAQARHLSIAALLTLTGTLLSGPVGVVFMQAVSPQPPWQGVEVFVENYSRLQTLPFVFGFLLVAGFLYFFAALVHTGTEQQRPLEMLGLVLAAVFGALISLNYIIQLAYIPNNLGQDPALLSMLTMANPKSLSWSLEMFGYAFLGLATWVVAPLFSGPGLEKVLKWLLIINGIVSVAGAVLAALNPAWMLSSSGLFAYVLWNLLVIVILILIMARFRFGRQAVPAR